MPNLTDKRKPLGTDDNGLEDATISRPAWALDHASPSANKSDTTGIPRDFLDAILEVIAKSIEQALADVVARIVAQCVANEIRPLAQETALLRIAIEHDWDNNGQRRRGLATVNTKETSEG